MQKDKNINNVINFPKKKLKLEREIEAIIFAADEPLDLETIEKRVGTTKDVKKVLFKLNQNTPYDIIDKKVIIKNIFNVSI